MGSSQSSTKQPKIGGLYNLNPVFIKHLEGREEAYTIKHVRAYECSVKDYRNSTFLGEKFTQPTSNTITAGDITKLQFIGVVLSRVPEKIIVMVQPSESSKWDEVLVITSASVQFGNMCGILCRESQEDLRMMSKINGVTRLHGLSENALCMDTYNDLSREHCKGVEGYYPLSFSVNVCNQSNCDVVNPVIHVMCLY